MNKTMKKTLFFSNICLLLVVFMFSSGTKNNDNLDEASLLIGKWQSGTLYETYSIDHIYTTWDTADDVTEAEAQKYEWALQKSTLTEIQLLEIPNYMNPKVYTVLFLDATTLVYEDDYGNKKNFTKVLE